MVAHGGLVHCRASGAENPAAALNLAVLVQVVQRGDELARGQVARAAENHHVERVAAHCCASFDAAGAAGVSGALFA